MPLEPDHLLKSFLSILSKDKTGNRSAAHATPEEAQAAPEEAQAALAKARERGRQQRMYCFNASDRTGLLMRGKPHDFTLMIRHAQQNGRSYYYISLGPDVTDAVTVELWKNTFAQPVYTFNEAVTLLQPFERRVNQGTVAQSKSSNIGATAALALTFAAQDDLAAWADDHFLARWVDSLLDREQTAVAEYSDTAFAWINPSLRKSDGTVLPPDVAAAVRLLDQAIAKGCFNRKCVVYRGFSEGELLADFAALTPGREYTDKAFVSTSLDREIADTFCGHGNREGILAIIELMAGHPCAYLDALSVHPGELEVLLPRGTTFRVKRTSVEQGRRCVYLEVIH